MLIICNISLILDNFETRAHTHHRLFFCGISPYARGQIHSEEDIQFDECGQHEEDSIHEQTCIAQFTVQFEPIPCERNVEQQQCGQKRYGRIL